MGRIIGIDLGTTNSAVAVWADGEPRLIVSANGSRLTPSVVAFGARKEVLVGEAAQSQAVPNASRTISSAKRFIGRQFDEVTDDRAAVAYDVVAGKKGEALIAVGNKRWTPEAISALLLGELKALAEASLGETVDGAVISVPAYFNDHQRIATREAGRLAGLDVRRIVNEPTAAALAYGLDKMHEKERTVVVYDFGGGTFDVSVLSVGDDIVEVIATHGDTHLGGDDIDARIAEWLREQFEAIAGGPVDEDAAAHQRLRDAAKGAKMELSTKNSVDITLPADGKDLHASLSLAHFEEMISDLVDRTFDCCAKALADARKQPGEVDEVLLVGGSSRIPFVRRRVSEYFGKEAQTRVDPEVVVAFGAAVQAGILSGEVRGIVLLDVTSLSLGIEVNDGRSVVVIPRNTTLPAQATRTFTTSIDGQPAVHFHVVQGEAERAGDNDSLGRFDLEGIGDAPAGVPQLEVTFAIDINGVVEVSAVDRATGLAQAVTVAVTVAVSAAIASKAAESSGGTDGEAEVDEERGVPSIVQATLEEAAKFLDQAGDGLAATERGALTKKAEQLVSLMTGGADAADVERARLALRRLIVRSKKAAGGKTGKTGK